MASATGGSTWIGSAPAARIAATWARSAGTFQLSSDTGAAFARARPATVRRYSASDASKALRFEPVIPSR